MTEEEKIEAGNVLNNKGWELQQEDPEKAILWYEKAVKLGNITAMINLGNIYEDRGDYKQAYHWYLEAALAGDERGMFNVANMHYYGEHVEQDYEKAYGYFEKLYKAGNVSACFYMGLYAENGFLTSSMYPA